MYTTHLFQKHLQYKPVANAIIPSVFLKLPLVKNALTFSVDQKLVGYDLGCVNVLLVL